MKAVAAYVLAAVLAFAGVPASAQPPDDDRQSAIGRLDKALAEAKARGWTVVSMKTDWKRVFADETP